MQGESPCQARLNESPVSSLTCCAEIEKSEYFSVIGSALLVLGAIPFIEHLFTLSDED